MKKILFLLAFLLIASPAYAANKYWVGGGSSANWNATGNTNWSDTDGGPNNATIPTTGDDVFFKSSANCTVNVDTSTPSGYLGSFNMTGYSGTLTGTTFLIRIGGVTGQTKAVVLGGTVSFTTGGFHLYPQASTNNLTFRTNGQKIGCLYVYGVSSTTATVQFLDDVNFTAQRTCFFYACQPAPNITMDFNGVSFIGNSSLNRLLVHSGNIGLARSLPINGKFTNADFRDISFSGNKTISSVADNGSGKARFATAGAHLLSTNDMIAIAGTTDYDGYATVTVIDSTHFDVTAKSFTSTKTGTWTHDMTQAGTVLAGDCGGNSGATFTAATTQDATISANKVWTTATWTAGRPPLPQDDVTFTGWSSGTLTFDYPRLGKNVDFSGATAGRTLATGTYTVTNYGSLNLTRISSLTGTGVFYFEGRNGTYSLTSPVAFGGAMNFQSINGTYDLASDFTWGSTASWNVTAGRFNTNGYTLSGGRTGHAGNSASLVTVDITNSTINLALDGISWSVSTTAPIPTLISTGSTINLTAVGTAAKNFYGAGLSYNVVNITGGGTGTLTFNSANTFKTLTIGAPKSIIIPAGVASTQTITDTFTATGTSSNRISIVSGTASSAAYIKRNKGGIFSNDYLDVTDITANPYSTFYYGANGTGTRSPGWRGVWAQGKIYQIATANLSKIYQVAKANVLKISGV